METKKDFILRELQKLSEFLTSIINQKPSNQKIDNYINEYTKMNLDFSLNNLLDKPISEIVSLIEGNNIENLKDFADIVSIKYTFETNLSDKLKLSELIINLYKTYQLKNNTYSHEIQTKIQKLEFFHSENL